MNPAILGSVAATIVLATTPVAGFAQESNAAVERARLAEQRIQAEAARRLEEEEASIPAASTAVEPAPVAATPRTAREQPAEPRRTARPAADLSLALEQLKTLGELKDSGYVDDEEFERIKKRILDANL